MRIKRDALGTLGTHQSFCLERHLKLRRGSKVLCHAYNKYTVENFKTWRYAYCNTLTGSPGRIGHMNSVVLHFFQLHLSLAIRCPIGTEGFATHCFLRSQPWPAQASRILRLGHRCWLGVGAGFLGFLGSFGLRQVCRHELR